mgnify:CR=1 FL=1
MQHANTFYREGVLFFCSGARGTSRTREEFPSSEVRLSLYRATVNTNVLLNRRARPRPYCRVCSASRYMHASRATRIPTMPTTCSPIRRYGRSLAGWMSREVPHQAAGWDGSRPNGCWRAGPSQRADPRHRGRGAQLRAGRQVRRPVVAVRRPGKGAGGRHEGLLGRADWGLTTRPRCRISRWQIFQQVTLPLPIPLYAHESSREPRTPLTPEYARHSH